MSNKKFEMISFFAGVGGIDLGFEQTGKFKTVYANEFDKNAGKTFSANFDPKILDSRDIRLVDPTKGVLKGIKPQVLLAGFPCQAFSIAGYRKGFEDERGDLFFETLRIIKEKKPDVVFLENVKNLVTHDGGNTFKVIREFLAHENYNIKWQVLNAKDFGNIPQNRERIYIVGFKEKLAFDKFNFPESIERTNTLKDVIDFSSTVDERYYYGEETSFYPELVKSITSQKTVYQWRRQYVRENKSGVVPTLTANMGTGGHNVPLVLTDSGRIRKLTPRETFNSQGYPHEFVLPQEVANGQLYKQAGNSVSVPVIKRIAECIAFALENSSSGHNVGKTILTTPGAPALIYTNMQGAMKGECFPIGFFDNDSERDKALSKLSAQSSEYANVPVYDDKGFYKFVRRGSEGSFISVIG